MMLSQTYSTHNRKRRSILCTVYCIIASFFLVAGCSNPEDQINKLLLTAESEHAKGNNDKVSSLFREAIDIADSNRQIVQRKKLKSTIALSLLSYGLLDTAVQMCTKRASDNEDSLVVISCAKPFVPYLIKNEKYEQLNIIFDSMSDLGGYNKAELKKSTVTTLIQQGKLAEADRISFTEHPLLGTPREDILILLADSYLEKKKFQRAKELYDMIKDPSKQRYERIVYNLALLGKREDAKKLIAELKNKPKLNVYDLKFAYKKAVLKATFKVVLPLVQKLLNTYDLGSLPRSKTTYIRGKLFAVKVKGDKSPFEITEVSVRDKMLLEDPGKPFSILVEKWSDGEMITNYATLIEKGKSRPFKTQYRSPKCRIILIDVAKSPPVVSAETEVIGSPQFLDSMRSTYTYRQLAERNATHRRAAEDHAKIKIYEYIDSLEQR